MIHLTRLNNRPLVVNSDLIKFIENAPDTVITLLPGKNRCAESAEEVINRIVDPSASRSANRFGRPPSSGDRREIPVVATSRKPPMRAAGGRGVRKLNLDKSSLERSADCRRRDFGRACCSRAASWRRLLQPTAAHDCFWRHHRRGDAAVPPAGGGRSFTGLGTYFSSGKKIPLGLWRKSWGMPKGA